MLKANSYLLLVLKKQHYNEMENSLWRLMKYWNQQNKLQTYFSRIKNLFCIYILHPDKRLVIISVHTNQLKTCFTCFHRLHAWWWNQEADCILHVWSLSHWKYKYDFYFLIDSLNITYCLLLVSMIYVSSSFSWKQNKNDDVVKGALHKILPCDAIFSFCTVFLVLNTV